MEDQIPKPPLNPPPGFSSPLGGPILPSPERISQIYKDIPASSIGPDKTHQVKLPQIDLYPSNSEIWRRGSEQLLHDYKMGWNFAKFGNRHDPFLKKLADALIGMISTSMQDHKQSAEDMVPVFNLIQSTFDLIIENIARKKIKNLDQKTLVSFMHGFVDAYIQEQIIKQEDGVPKKPNVPEALR